MIQLAMQDALGLIEKVDKEFGDLFGRRYGLIDPYRCDDAEYIFVTSGTVASTTRKVIDDLRDEGIKAGSLKIRVFRPFPFEAVLDVLSKAKKVAVIDRNISFGSHGIFYQEIKSALYGRTDIPIIGFIAGLGGRDITPKVVREIADKTIDGTANERYINWIGVKI